MLLSTRLLDKYKEHTFSNFLYPPYPGLLVIFISNGDVSFELKSDYLLLIEDGVSSKLPAEAFYPFSPKLMYIKERASLNTSASHFPRNLPPFCDWLYADRLHTIDRYGVSYLLLR
ncbi:hypothetical protein T02_14019 [Trichinella nativa]|uniref:Uncharacterized protein n=1 Tax=Trichinella nativa TaxID=6335 RepID=A0A0V1LR53_9BILA|nr:hypothetical protein T02_14019 [Trichinella nativa]